MSIEAKPFRIRPANLDAPKKRKPPVERVIYSADPVEVVGESLHPVLWQGRQWAVTTYGLEARDGTYAIEADRLREGWVDHMREKVWVDVPDFITGFLCALSLHPAD